MTLDALFCVTTLGLSGKPGTINAGPLAKVQNPLVVCRLFTTDVSSRARLGTPAIGALERQEFCCKRVHVHEHGTQGHRDLLADLWQL